MIPNKSLITKTRRIWKTSKKNIVKTPSHAAALLILFLQVIAISASASAGVEDLLEMSEKLDRIEKQDFMAAIDKANACTRARDFACTEAQLAKASKSASSSRDKQTLLAARQNMASEKAQMAEETRQRAEEDRQLALAEERMRQAEAGAERAARAAEAEDSGPSTASQLLQLGSAIAGQYQQNQAAKNAASAANRAAFDKMQAEVKAGIARDQQRFAEQRAQILAARQAREQAQMQASNTRVASASRVAEPTAGSTASAQQHRDLAAAQRRERDALSEAQKKSAIDAAKTAADQRATIANRNPQAAYSTTVATSTSSGLVSSAPVSPANVAAPASTAGNSPNEARKTILCPSREYFTSLIYYRPVKNEEPVYTLEAACVRAEKQASAFVDSIRDGSSYTYSKSKVKLVEPCQKTKSGDQAVVYVHLETPTYVDPQYPAETCSGVSRGVSK
ncbi:MAG TPA: hypothetical protein VF928_06505 [Usitatibacteraceae bacterium]